MPIPVHATLTMSRIALGESTPQHEFHYGLFAEDGTLIRNTVSVVDKRIIFHDVLFTDEGIFNYTVRETISPPQWVPDTRVWPVRFEVTAILEDVTVRLAVAVTYPEGVPLFANRLKCENTGLVEFPELCFDAPGIYEYTMKEETPSGDGWVTDDRVVRVLVHVEDDGHGHLVAFMEYPDGFPMFTNTYTFKPVCINITGSKLAVGAPLPPGKFTFGLYDEDGTHIATTTNGPADDVDDADDNDADN